MCVCVCASSHLEVDEPAAAHVEPVLGGPLVVLVDDREHNEQLEEADEVDHAEHEEEGDEVPERARQRLLDPLHDNVHDDVTVASLASGTGMQDCRMWK